MSLRDLRLELVLSPIIANIRHKRVLNNKYILNDNTYYKRVLNDNPFINNTFLPPKTWLF